MTNKNHANDSVGHKLKIKVKLEYKNKRKKVYLTTSERNVTFQMNLNDGNIFKLFYLIVIFND